MGAKNQEPSKLDQSQQHLLFKKNRIQQQRKSTSDISAMPITQIIAVFKCMATNSVLEQGPTDSTKHRQQRNPCGRFGTPASRATLCMLNWSPCQIKSGQLKETSCKRGCHEFGLTYLHCGNHRVWIAAMIGENRQLVINEPVEFKKELVEGKLPIILEEFIEYTPIW